MKNPMVLVEFECQGCRFALPAAFVRRVISSARVMPLPGAPPVVLGMLDLGGEFAIIINFFLRVGLPWEGINITQQFLLLEMSGTCIGLVVDRVHGALFHDVESRIRIPEKFSASDYVESVFRTHDGLCIICNPEEFLFEDEKIFVDGALAQFGHAEH